VNSRGPSSESERSTGLSKSEAKSEPYTVRLHFSEPAPVAAGERVFDVALQGRTVIERLDISQVSGGRNSAIVREFTDVEADSDLRISL